MFRYSRRAIQLVWSTNRALTIGLAIGSLIAGILPDRHRVRRQAADQRDRRSRASADVHDHARRDDVGRRRARPRRRARADRSARSASSASLLRQQLGQSINVEILEKALTLELTQFEDSELYDKLTRARREASSRPLSLVSQTFELGQSLVTLIGLGGLLAAFSPIALGVLIAAAIPPFIAELKFSGDAFRLSRWRTPETREQMYVETGARARGRTRRRSSCSASGRASSTATRRSSRSSTPATARSRSAAACGRSIARHDRPRWRSTACTCGSRSRRSTARSRSATMTMYVARLQAGAVRAVERARRHRRHVRGQPLPVEPLRVPRHADDDAAAAPRPTGPSPATACASSTCRSRTRARTSPRSTTSTCTSRPAASSRSSARTARGKTTLIKLLTRLYEPTDGRDHARRPRPPRVGTARRCTAGSASSSRTSCATSSRSARTSAPATTARTTIASAGTTPPSAASPKPFIETLPDTLRHAARQVVPRRPRAVARPVAEGRARALVHAPATPTSSCSTSRPHRWTPRPR